LGKSTVFANKEGVTSKNSDATVMSPLDVCLTPMGSSMVAVPYSNVAKSKTLDKGSKTVKVDGASAAIDGCCYSKSTGDEAGSGKGISSGTVGGKAEFLNCSSTVFIEGKGVCRNGDLMTLNSGNTIGINEDSSDPPPEPKIPPPPKDTIRIKVVEHISWDNYDKKTRWFQLGHEDNKPLEGIKFQIKLPDGGMVEENTDDRGMIELTGQDPHGRFEIIYQPGQARQNSRRFISARGITPLKRIE
jgi:uncharacterized Zn-binding protein involved in type VI secretion